MALITHCHINEFFVESEIALPCDSSSQPARSADREESPHISIYRASLADIPCTLRKVRRQLAYDVGDGFLIEPKDDLALHINLRGDTIRIDCSDERLPTASAWAIHAGLGAATLLRGGLPLHGAGLQVKGKFIGLIADSGTGKSTLSWLLLQSGAKFANDDLIPAYATDEAVTAYPAVSLYPKLSREAVDRNGVEIARLLPADYGNGEEEYHLPLLPPQRTVAPAPLAALVLLRPYLPEALPGTDRGKIIVERLAPETALPLLSVNLHAAWIIGKYLNQQRLQKRCALLSQQVPFYVLRYERTLDALPRLEQTIYDCLDSQDRIQRDCGSAMGNEPGSSCP